MDASGYKVENSELAWIKSFTAACGERRVLVRAFDVKQGWSVKMGVGQGLHGALKVAGRTFAWGLSGHADCEMELRSEVPLKSLRGFVGIEENAETVQAKRDSQAVFTIEDVSTGECLWKSASLDLQTKAQEFALSTNGRTALKLRVTGIGSMNGHLPYGHANWGELVAETLDGSLVKVGEPAAFGTPSFLPMDFRLGEEAMDSFLLRNGLKRSVQGGTTVFRSEDAKTGLALEFSLKTFTDFPVCEWHIAFENNGSANTPSLHDVKSLRLQTTSGITAPDLKLIRGRGSFHYQPQCADSFRDGFLPVVDSLSEKAVDFGAVNGRCSDPWLPFFNVKLPGDDGGFVFALGWPAQWQASVSNSQISAGMERFNAYLEPGERFEFPSLHLLRYDGGDYLRGNNLLRRFIHERVAPRYDGEPIRLPASKAAWGGMPENEHLERLDNLREKKLPFDVYWIDAGWYAPASDSEFTPEWSQHVGDWRFHPSVFPQGLAKMSERIHADGMQLLLWFEPERAIAGSALPTEHPDWFLGTPTPKGNLLLNLGHKAACDWCIDYISKMVEENGIDWYREDFNIDPLPYWRLNDTPEREGVTELKAAAGLYRFWGELRRRHPHLKIDNCASGGRRIEIELLKYSVPLWHCDMMCYPDFNPTYAQTHIAGASLWLPSFGSGVQNPEDDTYKFRSGLAEGINMTLFYRRSWKVSESYHFAWLRERLEEYLKIRDCFTGDFYPLGQGITKDPMTWSLSQYDRPDLGRGVLLAFRREASPFKSADIPLNSLKPEALYELEDLDSRRTWRESGSALLEKGVTITLDAPRSSRIITYALAKV